MSKLFPGPLVVAPAFVVSTDCERTVLKADSIHIGRLTGGGSRDHDLRSRSPQRRIRIHRHHSPSHFDNRLLPAHSGANVRDYATRVVSLKLTIQMQNLHSTIVDSTVVPSTPGQCRPGRSQLPAMLCRQPMTGRCWRQEGAVPALSAVVRE
jgi:hypothetical protein